MKNKAKVELILEDKVFVNEQGEAIEYVGATILYDGEEIRVSVKKEDRSLLRVLRRSMEEIK